MDILQLVINWARREGVATKTLGLGKAKSLLLLKINE